MKIRLQIVDGEKSEYIYPLLKRDEKGFFDKIQIEERATGVKSIRINDVFVLEGKKYKVLDVVILHHSEAKHINIEEELIINFDVELLDS